ncbi:MAG: KpsF/GutQ family sugar-phosphate isomerase [Rickettsiales bacterium]|nr:KpsF/GutQ family sugar-phosphate isomerase [Rickettsiales bacterium]
MSPTDIEHGKAVLQQAIKGLSALSEALNGDFSRAVDCLASISGRVIVTGMGKSGHVARKIAATMASTGTPAHFVHPGEASHGDLGMITPADAVVALSNSGETAELADIIAYCKRFSIPLIGIARRQGSMLVEAADIALVLPDTPEASPTNAPTTSTTMMIALGDALAVALLERRGFTPEHFSVFHPGGKLGQAFIRVTELMHSGDQLPLVTDATQMQDVLLTITAKSFGCAGVINKQGKLIGVITDGDLRRHMHPDLLKRSATEIMTKNPVTIRAQALAVEATKVMNDRSITSLFVVQDDKPVGIIHVHDCLRAGIV